MIWDITLSKYVLSTKGMLKYCKASGTLAYQPTFWLEKKATLSSFFF